MGFLVGFCAPMAKAFLKIGMAMASEEVATTVVIGGLEKLAEKTTNTLDDKIVATVKEKLNR